MRSALLWSVALAGASALAWEGWRGPRDAFEQIERQRSDVAELCPVLIGGLAAGICSGLARRERVRGGEGYSSPLAAWFGKRLVFASICLSGLFMVAPLAWSIGWVYAAAFGLGMGAAAYAGNLPARL